MESFFETSFPHVYFSISFENHHKAANSIQVSTVQVYTCHKVNTKLLSMQIYRACIFNFFV